MKSEEKLAAPLGAGAADHSSPAPTAIAQTVASSFVTPVLDQYLTKEQVLTMLSCSATTLYELCRHHSFPPGRVYGNNANSLSGRTYYLLSEVQRWMKTRPVRVLKCDRKAGGGK